MSGVGVTLPAYIKSGDLARLIPVVADGKKEERVTSSLLATFMVVPALANELLDEVGAPTSKRSQIVCLTEVVLADQDAGAAKRPDGLILVNTGRKSWSALVEAKVGNSELNSAQIEDYLKLAKKHNIDAVITLSNQFAALPTHHPVDVSASKLRSVDLYHFSWMAIIAKAQLLAEHGEFTDPEQSFIIRELIRYLQHDSSGAVAFNSMGKRWKEVCQRIQQGSSISKSDQDVMDAVTNWHALTRYMSLDLTSAVGRPVKLLLNRSHARDPAKRLEDGSAKLISNSNLSATFHVPDAASSIEMSADLLRRTLNFSMRLEAPKDRARPTSAISFYTRQLKQKPELNDLIVRAHWPGRVKATDAILLQAHEDQKVLVPSGVSVQPTYIEFIRVLDLAGKFQGSKTFVENCVTSLKEFYADVGQNLKSWTPAAPKIRTSQQDVDADRDIETDTDTSQTAVSSVVEIEPSVSETEPIQTMPEPEAELVSRLNPPSSAQTEDDELRIPSFLIRNVVK